MDLGIEQVFFSPYKEGTSSLCIIKDGWYRGFEATQITDELNISGYERFTVERVQEYLDRYDREFKEWCEENPEEDGEEEGNPGYIPRIGEDWSKEEGNK